MRTERGAEIAASLRGNLPEQFLQELTRGFNHVGIDGSAGEWPSVTFPGADQKLRHGDDRAEAGLDRGRRDRIQHDASVIVPFGVREAAKLGFGGTVTVTNRRLQAGLSREISGGIGEMPNHARRSACRKGSMSGFRRTTVFPSAIQNVGPRHGDGARFRGHTPRIRDARDLLMIASSYPPSSRNSIRMKVAARLFDSRVRRRESSFGDHGS